MRLDWRWRGQPEGQQHKQQALLPVSATASSSSSAGRKRSRRWLGTRTGIDSRLDGIGLTYGIMYVLYCPFMFSLLCGDSLALPAGATHT